jgi:multidrug efflux pump subunit AcrA (membrane-fusion protein)
MDSQAAQGAKPHLLTVITESFAEEARLRQAQVAKSAELRQAQVAEEARLRQAQVAKSAELAKAQAAESAELAKAQAAESTELLQAQATESAELLQAQAAALAKLTEAPVAEEDKESKKRKRFEMTETEIQNVAMFFEHIQWAMSGLKRYPCLRSAMDGLQALRHYTLAPWEFSDALSDWLPKLMAGRNMRETTYPSEIPNAVKAFWIRLDLLAAVSKIQVDATKLQTNPAFQETAAKTAARLKQRADEDILRKEASDGMKLLKEFGASVPQNVLDESSDWQNLRDGEFLFEEEE